MRTPTPESTLRTAGVLDARWIEALMKASIEAIFPNYYTAAQTASSVRYVGQVDRTLLEDGTYYALFAEDEPIACGGWSRRRRPYAGSAPAPDDDQPLDPARDAAHVRAMFVRPDWTRRGLGRRIIEACEAAAAADGFVRLDLVATLPGVPLYAACGFVPDGDIEDVTLQDGVRLPCLAMHKNIAGRGAGA